MKGVYCATRRVGHFECHKNGQEKKQQLQTENGKLRQELKS